VCPLIRIVANCVADKKFPARLTLSFGNPARDRLVASSKCLPLEAPGRTVRMRKQDLDHLLEAAVAKALGVTLPRKHRRMVPVRKAQHPIKHAA
jgi:hypothetical protein